MKWTQAPHFTDEELETLLKEANLARFCSLNPDGTIHAVPVCYKYENRRILINTPKTSRKVRNVMSNGTVTVLIDVVGEKLSDYKGAIVYGKAKVKDATLSEIMQVGEVWMPADKVKAWSKAMMGVTDWVMIIVDPQSTASFDYAKDEKSTTAIQE
jgi:nitroimidazol reductase NimA-like FMN-containing flavoprotein (pyridoxamine 5'-phosphate oxidase superfamily)